MGNWLKKYGESIYGTRGGPYKPGTWGGATCKGNTVYLHITQQWPKGVLNLPPLPAKILKATALTGGTPTVTQNENTLTVMLDSAEHGHPDTIIKLELDKKAFDITPFESENAVFVSLNASAKASSQDANWRGWAGSVTLQDFEVNMPETKYYGEDSASPGKPEPNHAFKPTKEMLKKYPWIRTRRDHIWRFWRAKPEDRTPWIEVDLGKPKKFNKVTILEKFNRIKEYQLQYLKDGKWVVFHEGSGLGQKSVALAKPVTSQKVRIQIILWGTDNVRTGPGIREFDIWYDKNN